MRFLGGFLKFVSIIVIVAATGICAIIAVAAGEFALIRL